MRRELDRGQGQRQLREITPRLYREMSLEVEGRGGRADNSTLMRIADLYSEDRNNHPVFFMITIDLDL